MTDQATDRAMAWEGHTPLPWRAEIDTFDHAYIVGSPGKGYERLGVEGEWDVAELDYNSELVPAERVGADAALIVHRVNQGPAADAMAEAMDGVRSLLDMIAEGFWKDCPYPDVQKKRIAAFNEALAAYRGQQ